MDAIHSTQPAIDFDAVLGADPDALVRGRISRRRLLQFCAGVAATMGLSSAAGVRMAQAAAGGERAPVIWLHGQECTGCTETLLRSYHPTLESLLLDVVSLDYHDTLCVGAGQQALDYKHAMMAKHKGKYVLVTEGGTPMKDGGIYCKVGGKTQVELVREAAEGAAAVIAIGSCASWGGVPSADPNPTGAVGVDSVVSGKPIVNLPGCPPNPYNLLAVVLEYVTMGRLPALDEYGRPKFAYDRVIHENCPRRAHFDAGRFATAFGDEGHRKGWCLYKLGCKGPVTHAACATRHFNEVPGVWPIGTGVPCFGCTEKNVVWSMGTFQTVPIHLATPPETYPPIYSTAGGLKVGAAALVGAVAGAVGGAAWVASQKFQSSTEAGVARVAADIAHAEKLKGKTQPKKED